MDFRFGAGDRGPPGYTSSVPGPLPPPLEWQAPPRELVIREQVTRRLTEEWAKGDPAFARDLNRGFGPDPFFAPDRFMPPPPHAPMPMPMHPLPHAPPPVPFEEFGGWQGFGPPRLHVHAGFGERTRFLFGARWGSTPRPDPKHKLKLLEVEPSGRPEVCGHRRIFFRLFRPSHYHRRATPEVLFQIRHEKSLLSSEAPSVPLLCRFRVTRTICSEVDFQIRH